MHTIREAVNYARKIKLSLKSIEEDYLQVWGAPYHSFELKEEDANETKVLLSKLRSDCAAKQAIFKTFCEERRFLLDHMTIINSIFSDVLYCVDSFSSVVTMSIENIKLKKLLEKRGENKVRDEAATDAPEHHAPSVVITNPQTFGSILKGHRKAAKLSQQELAERSDLTRSNISQLETDSWEPRLNTILKLADALNLEPAALLPQRTGRQR